MASGDNGLEALLEAPLQIVVPAMVDMFTHIPFGAPRRQRREAMRLRWLKAGLLALAPMVFGVNAAFANLLVNGGFETGDLDDAGWAWGSWAGSSSCLAVHVGRHFVC